MINIFFILVWIFLFNEQLRVIRSKLVCLGNKIVKFVFKRLSDTVLVQDFAILRIFSVCFFNFLIYSSLMLWSKILKKFVMRHDFRKSTYLTILRVIAIFRSLIKIANVNFIDLTQFFNMWVQKRFCASLTGSKMFA